MKPIKYPKGIKAVYDNGGETADRYTVLYTNRRAWWGKEWFTYACQEARATRTRDPRTFYPSVNMSASPFHPQGVGQHSTARIGKHLGKRIPLDMLPEDCLKLVNEDLK